MKRFHFCSCIGLMALSVLLPFAGQASEVLRVTPLGYRVEATGEIVAEISSEAVSIEPTDQPSVVWSDGAPLTYTAKPGFGYEIIGWQQYVTNPLVRYSTPVNLTPDDPTKLVVSYREDLEWIYIVAVLRMDNDRTLTLGKSPFGEGTIGTNYGVYACQKGDVFKLAAAPKHDDATGFDHATFRRWSDGVTSARRTVKVNTNETYVAEFVPNVWQAAFDACGGELSVSSKWVTCDSTYGRLPTPTRRGHSFAGWLDKPSKGASVTSETIVGAVGNHTLYAGWDVQKYLLSARSEGEGSGTFEGVGVYDYGTVVSLKAKPAAGSSFEAWADGVAKNPRDVTVTSNATYVARFAQQRYVVKFSYRDAAGEIVSEIHSNVTYGSSVTAPGLDKCDVWTGHPFKGWSTDKYLNVPGDLFVGAQYEANTYRLAAVTDPNGEGSGTFSGTGEYDYGSVVSLRAIPVAGSSFECWADGETHNPREVIVTNHATYVARFARQRYVVKFDYRDAAGQVVSTVHSNVTYGASVTPPTLAECDVWVGHPFKGWSTDAYQEVRSDLVVTARYEADRCTLAAIAEGSGTGTFEGTGSYEYGTVANLLAKPSAGSAFSVWADGETRNPRSVQVVSNATYAALFQVATNRVTFTYRNREGQEVTTGEQLVEYGQAAVPPADHDEWPEHTFSAWSSDAWKKVTEDLIDSRTVRAIYDSEVLDVVFTYRDAEGNSVTSAVQHVVSGRSATPPPASVVNTWKGHVFAGWQPDYTVIRQDSVITAVYDASEYTVTFRYCDVEGKLVNYDMPVTNGAMVSLASVEGLKNQWPNHTFICWTYGDGSVVTPPAIGPVTSDMTIYANYNGYARIYFSGNGAAGEMPPLEFTNSFGWVQLKPNQFAKEGYKFAVWTNDVGKTWKDQASIEVKDGDRISLYATWEPIKYTFKFDANGHGEIPEKVDTVPNYYYSEHAANYDEPISWGGEKRLVKADSGWKHVCWSLESDRVVPEGGIKTTCINLTSNDEACVTLYAVWVPLGSYTVHFERQGATTGEMPDQTIYCGEETSLTSNAYERTGYTFSGWATTSSGSVSYQDGASVTDLANKDETANLYAVWSPIKYSVRFNAGEGTGTMSDQMFVYDKPQPLSPNGFKAPANKVFNVWTNVTGKAYEDKEEVKNLTNEADGVVDLFATWRDPPVYTVRFDGNGKTSGSMDDQTIYCGKQTSLTSNAYKRIGYTFSGWAKTSSGSVSYQDGASVTDLAKENETATLYAVWAEHKTYKITFYPAGGTPQPEQKTYESGAVINDLPSVSKTGYEFAGWYDGSARFESGTKMPASDVTLTARWTANKYSVRFNAGEGKGTMVNQSFVYDDAQPLSPNGFTAPANMVFDAWTNVTGKAYEDKAVVSNLTAEANGVVDLYATWRYPPSYTVHFDGRGESSGSMGDQTIVCGVSTKLQANGYVRTGYIFAGWATSAEDAAAMSITYADGASVTDLAKENETATLYAVWAQNTFEASFVTTSQVELKKITFVYKDGGVIEDPNLTRIGYTSVWKTDGKEVTFPCPMQRKNMKFTRYDTPITYTIVYDGNGGEPSSTELKASYDSVVTLPDKKPTKEGYDLTGWSNDVNKVVYRPGETVSNLTTVADATVTLYAQWKPSKKTLAQALGISGMTVTSNPEGAWTVCNGGEGIQRTGKSANGSLEIEIENKGNLKISFETNGNNDLVVKLDGKPVYDAETGDPAEYSNTGNYTLSVPKAGMLKFEGSPGEEETWVLKTFQWTAE